MGTPEVSQQCADVPNRSHWFVVPDLDGPLTGGTLYNRELIAALSRAAFPARALDLASARRAFAEAWPGFYWVDSLYLELFSELRALTCRVGLILHYLPSLIASGGDLGQVCLSPSESLALRSAHAFLAPSRFMSDAVARLAGSDRAALVVEPGRFADGVGAPVEPSSGVEAVLVANLLPEKGVARFLAALADELVESDRLRLSIIGSSELDVRYAATCRDLVSEYPRLRERVVFEGALPPRRVVTRMSSKNLFISASVMEAYGMALAEARTLGLPIVARDGGNVSVLVDLRAGGELARSDAELAKACVRVARDPRAHVLRLERARWGALGPRPWSDAARELIAQLRGLEL
jgi:hypothetical protein